MNYRFTGLVSVHVAETVRCQSAWDVEGRQQYTKVANGFCLRQYRVGSTPPDYLLQWGGRKLTVEAGRYITREEIAKGCLTLVETNGDTVHVDELEKKAILLSMMYGIREQKIALTDSELLSGHGLVFLNCRDGHVVVGNQDIAQVNVDGNAIFGVDVDQRGLKKFNLELKEEWNARLNIAQTLESSGSVRSWYPTRCAKSIIANFGFLHLEKFYVPESIQQFKRGLLAAIDAEEGDVLWQRIFEWSIEDCCAYGGDFYVVSGSELHQIDPATGQTINVVDTRLIIPAFRAAVTQNCLATIHINDQEIYFMPEFESRIVVYDRKSFTVLREYRLPEHWGVREFAGKNLETGEIYFCTRLFSESVPDCHRDGVLAFNPTTSPLQLGMELEPEIEVALKPASTDASQEELWITIRNTSTDKMIRFGELYTQNHCYRNGKNYGNERCESNPRFNGKVHFRVKGIDAPEGKVLEYLKIFEDRFALWNGADDGGMYIYAGTDGRTLCTLDTALEA